jgi:hypothetical protein
MNTAKTESGILFNNYHTVLWKFNDMEETYVPYITSSCNRRNAQGIVKCNHVSKNMHFELN